MVLKEVRRVNAGSVAKRQQLRSNANARKAEEEARATEQVLASGLERRRRQPAQQRDAEAEARARQKDARDDLKLSALRAESELTGTRRASPPAAPRGGPPTNPEKPANQTMSAEGEKRERIGIVSPNESLDSCVPAFTLRASGAVAAALAEGRLDLDAGSGLVGVLDGLVDRAACTRLVKAAAAKCRFQRLQGGARGDSVSWVPLFEDAGDADFDAAFRPVKDLLQGVGAASNYRELTAVLSHLNDPVGVEGGAGGELRCHCVDEVEVPAAPPPAADLDAEIRETEEKLRRLRAAREAQQQQTLAASSAAAVGDGFVSVKVTDDGDAARRRTNDLNRAAMRARGAQLAECVPASACRPSKVVWDALNRGDLVENPGGLWGVLRGPCRRRRARAAADRARAVPPANRQPDVRGDGVAWLPLFRKDDDAWNAAFAPARLLAGVGPALDGFYKRDAPLLVPRNVQVAVYDGTTMNGGYGAHRDNAFRDTVSVGWKIADRQKSLAKSASLGAMSPWATSQGRSGTRGGTRKGQRPGGPPRPERIEERFDMDPEGPWRILAVHADGTNEMRGRPASFTSPAILKETTARRSFSISDADRSEKFQSIRKFGRVSQKHCDMLMDLLRRSGQTGVISVKVLGWEHVQPQLEETQRARREQSAAITRMSSGKHKPSP
ncbi:hypothetical protein SO694_001010103 [Aureococcus anophagefferens]|uniref:Uncharacterized protein n=1 Tax=Aureococcus anophagefferens TaxID=44056 RepID=A0ABR1FMV8_AURAN